MVSGTDTMAPPRISQRSQVALSAMPGLPSIPIYTEGKCEKKKKEKSFKLLCGEPLNFIVCVNISRTEHVRSKCAS